jgi:hypothetical protein
MSLREAAGEGLFRWPAGAGRGLHRDAAGRVGDRSCTGLRANRSRKYSPSDLPVTPFDAHVHIAGLEPELAGAHLKIQALTEQLREHRVKLPGPRSENFKRSAARSASRGKRGTIRDEVEAEHTARSTHRRAATAAAPGYLGLCMSTRTVREFRPRQVPVRGRFLQSTWEPQTCWMKALRPAGDPVLHRHSSAYQRYRNSLRHSHETSVP